MGRFDYVRYDSIAQAEQQDLKNIMESVEAKVDAIEPLSPSAGRAKALIHTKCEEAYMWMGKLIRDNQIARGGSAEEVAERGKE